MKRAPLLAIAAAVAVVAPLLVILASASNRAAEPEAEVVLTERELRLVPLGEGRRWAVLHLDWNRDLQWSQKEPGWFDGAKLATLGFDTRLPASHPRASGFYQWQPAREVFLALEHDGPAAAAADIAFPKDASSRSRLHPVDAALGARALRARHPDRHRILVVRAVVAAVPEGTNPAPPRRGDPGPAGEARAPRRTRNRRGDSGGSRSDVARRDRGRKALRSGPPIQGRPPGRRQIGAVGRRGDAALLSGRSSLGAEDFNSPGEQRQRAHVDSGLLRILPKDAAAR